MFEVSAELISAYRAITIYLRGLQVQTLKPGAIRRDTSGQLALEMMMIRSGKLFITLLILGFIAAAPAKAQTSGSSAADARTNTMAPVYDVTKEVKVQGTIQKIDDFGTNGPVGTHIMVQTAQGVVDAHLGFGAASKPEYLGIAQGQSVTLTGMMQSFDGANVLMARILTTSNHIFVLRNEHGIPVRAIPRGSNRSKTIFSSNLGTRQESARQESV
jgi:hypothetical protein